jgi:hypothetical protein
LYERGNEVDEVYFPLSGMISLLVVMRDEGHRNCHAAVERYRRQLSDLAGKLEQVRAASWPSALAI